jgi:transcriptional regulator with XRE-family HTH domain
MKPVDRKPRVADEVVSENLRRLRTLSGLSQGELGERLGVTTQQIQKYERASNRLSAGAIVQIADALGVEITDLFRGCRGTKTEIDRALSAGQLTVAMEFGKISEPRTRRLVSALIRTLAARPVQSEEPRSNEQSS